MSSRETWNTAKDALFEAERRLDRAERQPGGGAGEDAGAAGEGLGLDAALGVFSAAAQEDDRRRGARGGGFHDGQSTPGCSDTLRA